MSDPSAWLRWRSARRAAAPSIAANIGTHWLGLDPEPIEGLPGLWKADDGAASVERVTPPEVLLTEEATPAAPNGRARLTEGHDLLAGRLRLRLMLRGENVAVRVFDPEAPAATTLVDVAAFDHDPRWRISGHFTPAAPAEEVAIGHIDGWVAPTHPAGYIDFPIDDAAYRFTVTPAGEGYFAVFADASNSPEGSQFRFLSIPAADAEGNVIVDFNYAYLPPCSFSDHYLCPMPPPGNRIAIPVRAGESRRLYRTPAPDA
jgi:uncharacterized protein (DUF1684 family)